MRNAIKMLTWGVAGLTLTGALSLGAFAIAGRSLSSPATPLKMVVPSLVPTRASADATRSPRPPRPSNAPHNDTATHSPPPVVVIASSGVASSPPKASHEPDPSGDGGDKPAGDD